MVATIKILTKRMIKEKKNKANLISSTVMPVGFLTQLNTFR